MTKSLLDETNIVEPEVDEIAIDELIRELEAEGIDEEEAAPLQVNKPKPCCSFAQNFVRSWTKPTPESQMVLRFKKLAGIVSNKVVASLTLPTGQRVEFSELPHWWAVIRFKLCGFKYETYE